MKAGATDYIAKPFSTTELTARVEAALRRRAEPEPFRLEELAIDYGRRRVTVAGCPVPLTPTEYELLRALAINAGRVSAYDSLLRQVWGGRDSANTRVLHTFVKKLRRKLGDDAAEAGLHPDGAWGRLPHGQPTRPVTADAVEALRWGRSDRSGHEAAGRTDCTLRATASVKA